MSNLTRYIKEVRRCNRLTPAQEVELFKEYEVTRCKKIRNKIVASHQLFILREANKWKASYNVLDLINVGNLGLIIAIDKFDYRIGVTFLSYAVSWVNHKLSQFVYKHRGCISFSTMEAYKIRVYNRKVEEFYAKHGREPYQSELPTPVHQEQTFTSIDVPDGRFDVMNKRLEEFTDNDDVPKRRVDFLLSKLTEKEAEVVKLYFGIGYDFERSVERIANYLNIPQSKALSLKSSAFRKLKKYDIKKIFTI